MKILEGIKIQVKQRDHELIRGCLSDAPVRFGERELKDGMNNSAVMGYRESN